jgi:hypothetical protein
LPNKVQITLIWQNIKIVFCQIDDILINLAD